MVHCLVIGCTKRSAGRDKDVSFYRVPKVIHNKGSRLTQLSRRRREGFIAALPRADLSERVIDNNRVCSRHFISGRPADAELDGTACLPARTDSKSSQTDFKMSDNLLFSDELCLVQEAMKDLKLQLTLSEPFSKESVQHASASSKRFILFYTGLPNWDVLHSVFELVTPTEPVKTPTKLTQFQEFMLTLIKLRLNPPIEDLAYRFGVSLPTVSRIFHKWLVILDKHLRPLIKWPEREDLRKTMPECFQEAFGSKVAVVIDCFEVFIERPSALLTRAATWSSYKHHNTVKFLIGITPQCVISYISGAWGGRVSDKYLTEHCGLLRYLLPGDVVLADRGFDISDSVGVCQAKLYIPAFTKGKNQLSALEVEETRSIANVRIHVERVIGNVRKKYSILKDTLPIQFLNTDVDGCALVTLLYHLINLHAIYIIIMYIYRTFSHQHQLYAIIIIIDNNDYLFCTCI